MLTSQQMGVATKANAAPPAAVARRHACRRHHGLRLCAAERTDACMQQPETTYISQHNISTSIDSKPVSITRRSAMLSLAAGACSLPASTAQAAIRAQPFCGVSPVIPPWAFSAQWDEQVIPYAGFSTWTRSLGKPPAKLRRARGFDRDAGQAPLQPVLFLHGGPGLPSRYLESCELLGHGERRLVFYDQVGCGQSRIASKGKGPAKSAFDVQLFIDEIDAVRAALQLDNVHLVGHGWGGMLALSYVNSKLSGSQPGPGEEQQQGQGNKPPAGVLSLTLLATPPSYADLINDRVSRAQSLGEDTWAALRNESGSPEAEPAFKEAFSRYTSAFITVGPVSSSSSPSSQGPAGCYQIAAATSSPSVRAAMTGGKYFEASGRLAGWDATPWLSQVGAHVPSLVLHGSEEELSAATAQKLAQGLGPRAALVDVGRAGTLVHVDAAEKVLSEVEGHLKVWDSLAVSSA